MADCRSLCSQAHKTRYGVHGTACVKSCAYLTFSCHCLFRQRPGIISQLLVTHRQPMICAFVHTEGLLPSLDSMRDESSWPVIMAAGNAKDWLGPEHICLQDDLNYLCAEKVLPQQSGQTIEKWYSFMLVSVSMWLLFGFTL